MAPRLLVLDDYEGRMAAAPAMARLRELAEVTVLERPLADGDLDRLADARVLLALGRDRETLLRLRDRHGLRALVPGAPDRRAPRGRERAVEGDVQRSWRDGRRGQREDRRQRRGAGVEKARLRIERSVLPSGAAGVSAGSAARPAARPGSSAGTTRPRS